MLGGFSLHDDVGRARVAKACEAIGMSAGFWAAFLETRARHADFGNRRRMFAAFDRFFDEGPKESAPKASEASAPAQRGDRIMLTRLSFKNWKVFQNASFDFPDYETDRPVVLIGGKNGYGKTSLLEGLLHGLFGRDANVDLDRSMASSQSATARSQTYRHTLERALHRSARNRGDGVMVVRSEWKTGEGDLIVERRWFFGTDGALVEDDEGLNLWIGPDREVLAVPDGEDAGSFYQAEIVRRLMPASLAAFVLFDGEQVKQFAQRDFAEQVRLAVETVLGLTVWREAIADLRAYAKDRSKGAVRNEEYDRATDEALTALRESEARTLDEIEVLSVLTTPVRARRDDILERLGALGRRTYASMQVMLERRQALAAEQTRAQHELATLASSELPFLMIGARLRSALQSSLQSDHAMGVSPDVWSDINALEQLLAKVMGKLSDGSQRKPVEAAIRNAWNDLCSSASPAASHRHAYLPQSTRAAAIERMAHTASGKSGIVVEVARRIQELTDERSALEQSIADHEVQDHTISVLKSELEGVTRELDELDDRRRVLDQALGRIQGELREKNEAAETRLVARMSDAQMISRRRAALDLAQRGEALIDQLKPDCFDAVGEAVTRAYCALAHKGLVSRIVIDPDGRVILMDELGSDVRAIEASAGESQIFAMALMAAVAELSGRGLPSVIDTPLGRLDPEHRRRVLQFFTSRDVQTILLSQPDEVNEHYLRLIEDKIAARFHLDHSRPSAGPGGSIPMKGYFPEIAA